MSRYTEEQLTDLICTNDVAFQVYLAGYSRGHQDGQAFMVLSNEDAADAAARRFLTLDALDIEIRREMKSTREFIDVKAARERDAR